MNFQTLSAREVNLERPVWYEHRGIKPAVDWIERQRKPQNEGLSIYVNGHMSTVGQVPKQKKSFYKLR